MTRSLEGHRHTERDRLCSHLSTGLISSRLQHGGLLSQCFALGCDVANTDNSKCTEERSERRRHRPAQQRKMFYSRCKCLRRSPSHLSFLTRVVTRLSGARRVSSLTTSPLMRHSLMTLYLTSTEYSTCSSCKIYEESWCENDESLNIHFYSDRRMSVNSFIFRFYLIRMKSVWWMCLVTGLVVAEEEEWVTNLPEGRRFDLRLLQSACPSVLWQSTEFLQVCECVCVTVSDEQDGTLWKSMNVCLNCWRLTGVVKHSEWSKFIKLAIEIHTMYHLTTT